VPGNWHDYDEFVDKSMVATSARRLPVLTRVIGEPIRSWMMQPLFATSGGEPVVTVHPPMSTRTRLPGAFPAAEPDPPPRPV
jgi:hypothetical protein